MLSMAVALYMIMKTKIIPWNSESVSEDTIIRRAVHAFDFSIYINADAALATTTTTQQQQQQATYTIMHGLL